MSLPVYGSTCTAFSNDGAHLSSLEDNLDDKFSINALWDKGYVSSSKLASIDNPAVRQYHENQNKLLEKMAGACDSLFQNSSTVSSPFPSTSPSSTSTSSSPNTVSRAILLSNACNLVLLCAQLYAFISSRSFSMLAVFIDALLDMVSGVVVGLTWYIKDRKDRIRYPVGRQRLEPLGVIAMACLMTAATLVTFEQAMGSFIESTHPKLTISMTTCVILLIALTIKVSLYSYCRSVEHDSCLLYTSPSPRDQRGSRMPSSA